MIRHIIQIEPPKKEWSGFGLVAFNLRSNDITDFDIYVALGEFKYRKNVSHKQVAKDLNNFFLVELICVFSRILNIHQEPLCERNSYCPIDNVWNEMKLLM